MAQQADVIKKLQKVYKTSIFRNGTKGKNVKKGKLYENVVSKARLMGDMLKLFDGESETICISDSTLENESTNQLSNKELLKSSTETTLRTLKESPVLGNNQCENRTKYLKNASEKNKEVEIVFEPIDIPEVIIDQNFDTEMKKEKKRGEKKKETTYSEHNKITSYNWNLHNSYIKLCARVSEEYKNVLSCMENPLSAARGKIKEICVSLQKKHTQHETVQELSNSKSFTSSVSEHQACTSSRNTLSFPNQFLKDQNTIGCPSKSDQHNKKNLGNFSIDQILSIDSNSWRDDKYSDISIVQNNNSKLPPKKRYLITTPCKELPTQSDDDEIITVDCDVSSKIFHKYSKEVHRFGSTKKFCETDFASMFQNLPTPSTVNRQLHRSKERESRNEHSETFKESSDLYTDVSNKEDKVVRFPNYVRSQAPLEVLTAAAAIVEARHLPQTETGNIFTDRYIPVSSNWCNSFDQQPSRFDQQPSRFYCSRSTTPSNFNMELVKQRHCTSQNPYRCEERHIYQNCPNSHEYNISQAHHQNHTESARTIVAPGCSYLPIYYNNVASDYVNLPHNMGHTRILPLLPNRNSYTYPQQVDDHQRMVCSQNCTQPVKYFALDNGTNVHKIPLYVKDCVCQCQDHRHKSIYPH